MWGLKIRVLRNYVRKNYKGTSKLSTNFYKSTNTVSLSGPKIQKGLTPRLVCLLRSGSVLTGNHSSIHHWFTHPISHGVKVYHHSQFFLPVTLPTHVTPTPSDPSVDNTHPERLTPKTFLWPHSSSLGTSESPGWKVRLPHTTTFVTRRDQTLRPSTDPTPLGRAAPTPTRKGYSLYPQEPPKTCFPYHTGLKAHRDPDHTPVHSFRPSGKTSDTFVTWPLGLGKTPALPPISHLSVQV